MEHLVTLLTRQLSKSLTPSSLSVRKVQQPSELCLWWTSRSHTDKPLAEVDKVSASASDSAQKSAEMHLSTSDF